MKNKPHLKFYKDNVKSGLLPIYGGLCANSNKFRESNLIDYESLKLFAPSEYDANHSIDNYWFDNNGRYFNNMRQIVILFIAAIHNEL